MEAEEYQDECRQAVRAIVIGAGPATSGPSRPAKVEPDVETLFASWAEEEGDEGVMQRALGAAHAARLLNTPHRGRASVPMTPRASDKRSTGQTPARVDPYIATGEAANLATLTPNSVAAGGPMGPGGAPRSEPAGAEAPGTAKQGQVRVPTHEAPPRMNIKEATKAKSTTPQRHMTLEEKLQERRRKERDKGSALRPFGVGEVPGGDNAGKGKEYPSELLCPPCSYDSAERRHGHGGGCTPELLWRSRVRPNAHATPDVQGLWRDVASRLEGPVPVRSIGLSSLCPVPLGQDSHSEAADPMNIGKVWSHCGLYSSALLSVRRLSRSHCVPWFPVRLAAVLLGHGLPTLGLGRLDHVPPPGLETCTGPSCQHAATSTATDDHQGETYEVILPECYGANLKGCLTHHHLRVDDHAAVALHRLSVFLCGLARSLLGILGLSLAGLLVHQLPGKHTPIGKLCRFPFRGTYHPSCKPLGSIGDPKSSALDWKPWVDRKGRLPRRGSPLGASCGIGKRSLFLALGVSCCPLQVWAAPKELIESVQAVQGTLAHLPEDLPACTEEPARSHPPPEPGNVWLWTRVCRGW